MVVNQRAHTGTIHSSPADGRTSYFNFFPVPNDLRNPRIPASFLSYLHFNPTILSPYTWIQNDQDPMSKKTLDRNPFARIVISLQTSRMVSPGISTIRSSNLTSLASKIYLKLELLQPSGSFKSRYSPYFLPNHPKPLTRTAGSATWY